MEIGMKVFLSFIVSLILAQMVKVIVEKMRGHPIKQIRMLGSGGMPSSHTSIVTAITSSIYLQQGLSALFSACACFSVIVIYDALVVRHQVGLHARELNTKNKTEFLERVGHTPLQVMWGILLGIAVSVSINLLL